MQSHPASAGYRRARLNIRGGPAVLSPEQGVDRTQQGTGRQQCQKRRDRDGFIHAMRPWSRERSRDESNGASAVGD